VEIIRPMAEEVGCGMSCIVMCIGMCAVFTFGTFINDDVAWTNVLL
jgi:hypothetical protein